MMTGEYEAPVPGSSSEVSSIHQSSSAMQAAKVNWINCLTFH